MLVTQNAIGDQGDPRPWLKAIQQASNLFCLISSIQLSNTFPSWSPMSCRRRFASGSSFFDVGVADNDADDDDDVTPDAESSSLRRAIAILAFSMRPLMEK